MYNSVVCVLFFVFGARPEVGTQDNGAGLCTT